MAAVEELSDTNFQEVVESSDVPVLVDFSATWCQPCKTLAPIIDEVAKEFEGRLLVRKIDIDQAKQTAIRFGIQGVPTCIFFRGGSEIDRFMGIEDLKQIRSRVEKVLAVPRT